MQTLIEPGTQVDLFKLANQPECSYPYIYIPSVKVLGFRFGDKFHPNQIQPLVLTEVKATSYRDETHCFTVDGREISVILNRGLGLLKQECSSPVLTGMNIDFDFLPITYS